MNEELIKRLREVCRGRQGTYAIRRDAGQAADALEAASLNERRYRLLKQIAASCGGIRALMVDPDGDYYELTGLSCQALDAALDKFSALSGEGVGG